MAQNVIEFNSIEAIPADKTQELNKFLDDRAEESRRYINTKKDDWKKYEDYYHGKQWRQNIDRRVENIIFENIETELPILTDSRPASKVIAYEEDDADAAEMLDAATKAEYRWNKLDLKIASSVKNALITGTGWLYVDWDPDIDKGQGHVVIKVMDWRNIDVDPLASDHSEIEFARLKIPMRVSQIIRRWPKSKNKIMEAAGIRMSDDSTFITDESEDHWEPSVSDEAQSANKFDIVKDLKTVEEIWIKDYSLEAIPEEEMAEEVQIEEDQLAQGINPESTLYENHAYHIASHKIYVDDLENQKAILAATALRIDPDELTENDLEGAYEVPGIGDQLSEIDTLISVAMDHMASHEEWGPQNPDGQREKYENGWRRIFRVGSLILDDGAPEVPMLPLVPVYCYKSENSIYGDSAVKNMLDQQKSLNELNHFELEGLKYHSCPAWIKDANSGVRDTDLTNDPRLIINKKQGTEVFRDKPGQVNNQLQIKGDQLRQSAANIEGMGQVTKGRKPVGVEAEGALQQLRESNLTRMREKARMLENYTTQILGEVVTKKILAHWPDSRKLMTWDDSGRLQRVPFDIETVRDLPYMIDVAPGSTVGQDAETIFTISAALYDKSIINKRRFVEMNKDIPNRADILQDIQEEEEIMAQVQALEGDIATRDAEIEKLRGLFETLGLTPEDVETKLLEAQGVSIPPQAQPKAPSPLAPQPEMTDQSVS